MKTLKISNIGGYQGALKLVQNAKGERFLSTPCSLKGERLFGPLKKHEAMAFNAIADLPEASHKEVNGLTREPRGRGTQMSDIDPQVGDFSSESAQYFLFLMKDTYDQGSLEGHLAYLRNYNGTPDCLDCVEGLAEAIDQARRDNEPMAIVDCNYNIVETIQPAESAAITW